MACGDCWCFRLLLSVVGTGLSSSPLKSPYFCSRRGDGRATVLQAHTRPGDVFFSRNMERTLMGKGVGRQTDGHFRGGKIWSLCALIYIHFQLDGFTSAGFQRWQKGEEETLGVSAGGNEWVSVDGSQGDSSDNSLSSWLDVRYYQTQHGRCTQHSVSHNHPKRVHQQHVLLVPSFVHAFMCKSCLSATMGRALFWTQGL